MFPDIASTYPTQL